MEPYQQRVVKEKEELDEKVRKLSAFITAGAEFARLPMTEQEELRRQWDVMRQYSNILGGRILRFEKAKELPLYQCHKRVRALKIAAVELHSSIGFTLIDGATITPANEQYKPFRVNRPYIIKHWPQLINTDASKPLVDYDKVIIGGYYVKYEDGYESFSPAKAFEEGYTLV